MLISALVVFTLFSVLCGAAQDIIPLYVFGVGGIGVDVNCGAGLFSVRFREWERRGFIRW